MYLAAAQRADCPVDTPYELLILASIIEKETGIDGERAMVASVFANRMATGMRLQSDPTTIYGIEAFDGNLTRAHLRENRIQYLIVLTAYHQRQLPWCQRSSLRVCG